MQRSAYQALVQASATALKRLANDPRLIGTHLPGFPGVLPTWGSQRQSHPHLHDIVPGGGLSEDRTTWLTARANFYVPVKALSPIYRALVKDAMRQAALLEQSDPQVWTTKWNVHRQANPNASTACKYLAPYGCKGAISNSRSVAFKDRTGTFTSRKPGSARKRTAHLEVSECIRRFLQHVLPAGCMQVRHFGCLHASCAIHTNTIRRIILQAHPCGLTTPRVEHPAPLVISCPTCGGQLRVLMRLWTSHRALVATGCKGGL